MKLLIENFYNIKHAELDFKKFNILIGPQAAGKSLIAKVLYFLEEVVAEYEIKIISPEESITEDMQSAYINLFYSIFEQRHINNDFKITLTDNNNNVWIFQNSGLTPNEYNFEESSETDAHQINFEILKSDLKHIKKLQAGLEDTIEIAKDNSELSYTEIVKLREKLEEAFDWMRVLPQNTHLFIPASRSLVNIIADNSFWMRESNVDALLVRFGQAYSRQLKKDTTDKPLTCNTLESITKGQIERQDSGYVINENGRLVSLANASSGQQATLPILVGLNRVNEASVQHTYIEEPEAHIFPEAQYLLTRYISEIHNQTNTNITLTTHSPYILTAVNNLIYAGTVGKQSEEKASKVKDIIPEDQWLNSEDVAAYMVEADGTVRSIMDEESGLIDADSIDSVSDKIGVEFDKIFDIEFNEEASDA
ncbi:AAA family ATPase [Desulfovibrio sp. JC022]|uniref:AAA family ATPase n=1 Tax=Desulfovibrio sp. JC022 TaxID=2593642 RepID=UPI0013D282EE|nr:AAA family ATPase [Desulfovibrio sp. JC022]NDV22561.1 ATP-binding protein [Desulfovibrio sp. JC022]